MAVLSHFVLHDFLSLSKQIPYLALLNVHSPTFILFILGSILLHETGIHDGFIMSPLSHFTKCLSPKPPCNLYPALQRGLHVLPDNNVF